MPTRKKNILILLAFLAMATPSWAAGSMGVVVSVNKRSFASGASGGASEMTISGRIVAVEYCKQNEMGTTEDIEEGEDFCPKPGNTFATTIRCRERPVFGGQGGLMFPSCGALSSARRLWLRGFLSGDDVSTFGPNHVTILDK